MLPSIAFVPNIESNKYPANRGRNKQDTYDAHPCSFFAIRAYSNLLSRVYHESDGIYFWVYPRNQKNTPLKHIEEKLKEEESNAREIIIHFVHMQHHIFFQFFSISSFFLDFQETSKKTHKIALSTLEKGKNKQMYARDTPTQIRKICDIFLFVFLSLPSSSMGCAW